MRIVCTPESVGLEVIVDRSAETEADGEGVVGIPVGLLIGPEVGQ
jgi:hypothetical protein